MLAGTLSRFAFAWLLAGALPAFTTLAQSAPKPGDADQLRQRVSEGAAFCKAQLASAPPEVKLGEVEDFCGCMGVQEAAMSEMAGADRTALRPQLQQMCIGIIRKQAQNPAPSAAVPPSPSTAPTAAQPAPAGIPAPVPVAAPVLAEKVKAWTITTNRGGAPIAYVRTIPDQMAARSGRQPAAPTVGAFVMYCRAKDTIGIRAIRKPNPAGSRIYISIAGDGFPLNLDRNGVAAQSDWATLMKEWGNVEKNVPEAALQRPDADPYVEVMVGKTGDRTDASVNLHGMADTRSRLRSMCADAIAKGAPIGNYDTTGIEGFSPEVIVGTPPNGTPADAPVVTRGPVAAPKPKADCSPAFERTYATLRRKELDLAGQTGAVMQNTPRFFWDFCPIVRQEVAAARQIIAAVNACPSHPRANGIRSEATAKLAKRQRELSRPRCM